MEFDIYFFVDARFSFDTERECANSALMKSTFKEARRAVPPGHPSVAAFCRPITVPKDTWDIHFYRRTNGPLSSLSTISRSETCSIGRACYESAPSDWLAAGEIWAGRLVRLKTEDMGEEFLIPWESTQLVVGFSSKADCEINLLENASKYLLRGTLDDGYFPVCLSSETPPDWELGMKAGHYGRRY